MSSERPVRCTYTVLLASSLWPQPLIQDVASIGREHLVAGLLMQSLPDALRVHGVDMRFVIPALVRNGDVDCLILVYDGITWLPSDNDRQHLVQLLHKTVSSNKSEQIVVVVATSMRSLDADIGKRARLLWADRVPHRTPVADLRARVCGFIKECARERAAAEVADTLEHEAAIPGASNS